MRPSLTKPIHICFDSNVRGILEQWYSTLEKTRENVTILELWDNLAIGPLKPENPALRKAVLQETGTEEVADSFCDDYRAFLQALTTLPPDRPCYVWASDSPHERTGVALAGAWRGPASPRKETRFSSATAPPWSGTLKSRTGGSETRSWPRPPLPRRRSGQPSGKS